MNKNIELTSAIRSAVREWFKKNGFLEVTTSSFGLSPGFDVYTKPFSIEYNKKYFLVTSPEIEMKGLISEGFHKIWQIKRSFRKEENDSTHRPEFDMLEWYRKDADYKITMSDAEELIRLAVLTVSPSGIVSRLGNEYDLSLPFEKISIPELFLEKTGLNLEELQDTEEFLKKVKSAGFDHIAEDCSWDEIFFIVFLTKIEPELIKKRNGVIIYDFPYQIISLARRDPVRPCFVERFECYAAGLEICNGYTELDDWQEHIKRFEKLKNIRIKKNLEPFPLPLDLERFINKGIGLCSGVALGMERLFMTALSCDDIRDVIPFDIFK